MTLEVLPRIVAVVPAYNNAEDIASTISSLQSTNIFNEIVVVDDCSEDETIACATPMGARVIRHSHNFGKGAALTTAIAAEPDADIYVFVDADTSTTAARVRALIDPLLLNESDLTIATLPAAGKKGGLGFVQRFARRQIKKATGLEMHSPLSGQRAIRGELARRIVFARRFGVEVAMTIDAYRLGAHIRELPLEIEHNHKGRTFSGFLHRARQGIDVHRATWPRVTSRAFRATLILIIAFYLAFAMFGLNFNNRPSSQPRVGAVSRVVLLAMPTLTLDDLHSDSLPNLRTLMAAGAVGATSVKTFDKRPNATEAYASIGAGSRVPASANDARAFAAADPFQGALAGDAVRQRTGAAHPSNVVVPGIVALQRSAKNKSVSSLPGTLGDVLHNAGYRTLVIGNADYYDTSGNVVINRPVATAAMDSTGSVDLGSVGAELLEPRTGAPFDEQANNAALLNIFTTQSPDAQFVVIDSGDLTRADLASRAATPTIATRMRTQALQHTDELLGAIMQNASPKTLFIVTSPYVSGSQQRLTPTVMAGPGVFRGGLTSSSTETNGLVTLTDLAPTVMSALGTRPSSSLVGHPIALQPGRNDVSAMKRLEASAINRDRTYHGLVASFVAIEAIVLTATLLLARDVGEGSRPRKLISSAALATVAFPLATLLIMYLPFVSDLTPGTYVSTLILTTAILTLAANWLTESAISALRLISASTVIVLLTDMAFGGRLSMGGLLANSPLIAARFHGFGNLIFAVLASSAILWGCLHVLMAPRRSEAAITASAIFLLVFVADGFPWLGSDIGGALTLAPVFVLLAWYLFGHGLKVRSMVSAIVLAAVAIALFAAFDLSRSAQDQTHLARFIHDLIHHTNGSASRTLTRKLHANASSLSSPWAWEVVVVGAFGLLLGWHRRLLIAMREPIARAALVSLVAVGIIGELLNDSGVVITGLVAIYIAAFVSLFVMRNDSQELVQSAPVVLRSDKRSGQPEEVLI